MQQIPEEVIESVRARIKKYDHDHAYCEEPELCEPKEVVELGELHREADGSYVEIIDGVKRTW